MARSPFSGTFQPNLRPTIATAPDTLVLINGENDIIGCPQCHRKFDWNKYITSVQVDLSVDSVPGSASVNMSIPRHTIDDFYFDGNPIITPMMEIEIYAKGYYLVGGLPQYYPIFWGIITEVGDNYSGGEHSVTIHANDILKWWEICKMNINPAEIGSVAGQTGRQDRGNNFFGTNPYDVIWTLAQFSMGDIVQGAASLNMQTRDVAPPPEIFSSSLMDMMKYWEQRFSHMRSNLLLFGSNGSTVRGDSLYNKWRASGFQPVSTIASAAVQNANNGGPINLDTQASQVSAIKTDASRNGTVEFLQSEYQTKLELANAAKEAIGFEFYMDVTGDIVFKPPFYNLDVIDNAPISWIQDIDVIDWDFSESESEVVTQLTMQGSMEGNIEFNVGPFADARVPSIVDYHLLRRYGWRSHTYNSEFMGSPNEMFHHGLDVLDRINSKRHRGTVTIPMRPELRLGFPIYIAPKDQIWYITGISHNIQFGGRATTSLTLTAKRTKFIAPTGVAKLNMTSPPPAAPVSKANPASVVQPSNFTIGAINPYPYTSNQLALAKYTLNLNNAAFFPSISPPTGTAVNPSNPSVPNVMRNPQTGRIVGFPNAVMSYVVPYQVPASVFNSNQGKMTSAQARAREPNNGQLSVNEAAFDQVIQATFMAGALDQLNAKYTNNVSTYGVNSAGIYVYAQDTSSYIVEAFSLNSSNLTPNPKTGITNINGDPVLDSNGNPVNVTPFVNGTSYIRPVSDSRGFEVVGHYRYGRGVSLSDGLLVYNPNGGPNTAVSVNTQVALSGTLFASLQAQTAGLTTAISTTLSPAQYLLNMQPSDQATSGTSTPGSVSTPGVSTSNTPGGTSNAIQSGLPFVGDATLGSLAQQGVTSTYTAQSTTLSRALTLSEMSVMDSQGSLDGPAGNCPCILSRVPFMTSASTQTPLIASAVPDNSTLPNPNTFGSTAATVTFGAATPQQVSQFEDNLIQPNAVSPTSPGDVANTVNQFLYSLYSALDNTHQALEAKLIGDQVAINAPQATFPPGPTGGGTNNTLLASIVQQVQTSEGQVSGAFSAASAEFRQATNTASANLSSVWTSFAASLQNSANVTLLTGQIATGKSQIQILQTQAQQLQAAMTNNQVNPGNLPAQLAELQQKISTQTSAVNSLQAQLAALPAPPKV